jgi:hypothetical protein
MVTSVRDSNSAWVKYLEGRTSSYDVFPREFLDPIYSVILKMLEKHKAEHKCI